jgi:DNA-binding response OmpR family regulator
MAQADPLSRRPRVLVVDDEWCIAAMVSMKLREAGLETVEAGDVETAVRTLSLCRPDLIITEVHLAGRSGLWLPGSGVVEPWLNAVPVIIMTGAAHTITPADVRGANICAVISKPFSPRDLLERSLAVLSDRYSLLTEVGPFSDHGG